jgi:hypothetical protein
MLGRHGWTTNILAVEIPNFRHMNYATSSNSNGPHRYGANSANYDENPWSDATAVPRLTCRATETDGLLQKRLSFDGAIGVIVLPDDWGMENIGNDSDSKEYGTNSGTLLPTLSHHDGNVVITTDAVHSDQLEQAQAAGSETDGLLAPEERPASTTSTPATPVHKNRYTTYFHHPEKRRQTTPGAFPGPSNTQT